MLLNCMISYFLVGNSWLGTPQHAHKGLQCVWESWCGHHILQRKSNSYSGGFLPPVIISTKLITLVCISYFWSIYHDHGECRSRWHRNSTEASTSMALALGEPGPSTSDQGLNLAPWMQLHYVSSKKGPSIWGGKMTMPWMGKWVLIFL